MRHLMDAPAWEAEGKGGGGGGRGGGAGGGARRHADVSTGELVPSSSVLSSSSQRSEKSKVLRQRRAAGVRNEAQDWSKSQVRLSLVWSDSFIDLSGLSVTPKKVLLTFSNISSTKPGYTFCSALEKKWLQKAPSSY